MTTSTQAVIETASQALDRGVWWFPQEYAEQFFVVKGVIGLLAVVLLIAHMSQAFRESMKIGQRARYLTLFVGAVVVTGGSGEQVSDHVVVSYRNLGGMIFAISIVISMIISIRESRSS